MPIHCPIATRRISQDEFKELASEVLGHVFAIHNQFGRFFDEQIYKSELAERMDGVALEVPIAATHGGFSKTYYADALVRQGGLFEFKASDSIHPRHRGQTLNYRLLLDLAHGKVINIRPSRVGHEFVNCSARLADLRNPGITESAWDARIDGAETFRDTLVALIKEWGAGLEISLYEEALTHFLGGDAKTLMPVPVSGSKGRLADLRMSLVAPDVAFKITALHEHLDDFEDHARKFIRHTPLRAICWANITQTKVTFTTLT